MTSDSLCRVCCECCIGRSDAPPNSPLPPGPFPYIDPDYFCVYLDIPADPPLMIEGLDPPVCGAPQGVNVPATIPLPAGNAWSCPGPDDTATPCQPQPVRVDRVKAGRWEGTGTWGCEPVCLRLIHRFHTNPFDGQVRSQWWLWVHWREHRTFFFQEYVGVSPPFNVGPSGTIPLRYFYGGSSDQRVMAYAVPGGQDPLTQPCGIVCDRVRPDWCVSVGEPEVITTFPCSQSPLLLPYLDYLREECLRRLRMLAGTYRVTSRQAPCWGGGGYWQSRPGLVTGAGLPFQPGDKILIGGTCPDAMSEEFRRLLLTGFVHVGGPSGTPLMDANASFRLQYAPGEMDHPIRVDERGYSGWAVGRVNNLQGNLFVFSECFRLPVVITPCGFVTPPTGDGPNPIPLPEPGDPRDFPPSGQADPGSDSGTLPNNDDPLLPGGVVGLPTAEELAAAGTASHRGCGGCGSVEPMPATRGPESMHTRCLSLGGRLEVRPDCLSGYGCRHSCRSLAPGVSLHLDPHPAVTVPRDDCGPDCPGYLPGPNAWDWRSPTSIDPTEQ